MLEQVDHALALTRAHLASTESEGTDIEFYLAGYVLAVAYAELENAFKNALRERCHHPIDPPVRRFTDQAIDRLVRSIRLSALSGILGYFDANCKESFQNAIRGSDSQASYDHLESSRHKLVHEADTDASIADVEAWAGGAKDVLREFRKALGLEDATVGEVVGSEAGA